MIRWGGQLAEASAASASTLAFSIHPEKSCERFINHRLPIIAIKTPSYCGIDLH